MANALRVGDEVKVCLLPVDLSDWTQAAIKERVGKSRRRGVITDRSDSHGLCYEVTFRNGTVAWFYPEEISRASTAARHK